MHLKVRRRRSKPVRCNQYVRALMTLICLRLSAIGNAYAVLSNVDKRRQYDQYGEERSHPSRQRQHRDFEADISPEDLFNMFFGGGFPSSQSKVARHYSCRMSALSPLTPLACRF